MPVPSYRKIHMNSSEYDQIELQLSRLKFLTTPNILQIKHLGDLQEEALENIEKYFIKNTINKYPYTVYIISTIKDYEGLLEVKNSTRALPQFFEQKIKTLNVKENNLLNTIELKQKKLSNIRKSEITPIFTQYAIQHKKIASLDQQINFLTVLHNKLGEYHDKKKQ